MNLKEAFTSKKFIFAICAIWSLAIFATVAATRAPAMMSMFDAFVGGVVAIVGAYLTGNVANKFVLGKVATKVVTEEEDKK